MIAEFLDIAAAFDVDLELVEGIPAGILAGDFDAARQLGISATLVALEPDPPIGGLSQVSWIAIEWFGARARLERTEAEIRAFMCELAERKLKGAHARRAAEVAS